LSTLRQRFFVSGFARSGTTLLAGLLDAQPQFSCVAESHVAPLLAADAAGGFHVDLSREARNRLLARHRFTVAGTPFATRIRPNDFRTADEFYRLALEEVARPDDLVVGHKINGYGPHKEVFGKLLVETDVRCIHILRDARDVLLSQSNFIVESVIDPQLWVTAAQRLRELGEHPRLAIVRYEELVRDPARALAPVEKLLGLPLVTELRTLAYRGHPWVDNSSFHDVDRLFDSRAVERWRAHTHVPVVRFAAWRCADELARWGYAPFPESFSWRERARFARAAAVRRASSAARPVADAVRRWRDP
jgi:hypothetical protein